MTGIDSVTKLLESEVYGNGLTQWGIAAALSVATLTVALLVRLFLSRSLPAPQVGKDIHWPEVLHELVARTWTLFLIIAAIYVGTTLLDLPDAVHRLVSSVFIVALFVQLAVWADRIASAILAWRLSSLKSRSTTRNALALIQFIVRVAVWSLALLLIFENLGFDVTALVAGLGVGGIAVALAAQSVLGDLFSSLAIVLDRPFEVGDMGSGAHICRRRCRAMLPWRRKHICKRPIMKPMVRHGTLCVSATSRRRMPAPAKCGSNSPPRASIRPM
jgi:hypothetical protein